MSAHPRPDVAPAPSWSFPFPTADRLDNGLSVLTVNLPGQHVISLRLGLPVSLSVEPRAIEGVASLMAHALDEGTHRHTSQEFADLIERYGIAFGAGVSSRGIVLEMEVIAEHFEAGLDILSQCLQEAAHPDVEVQRLKRARISDIEHNYADAGARAAIEFAATYYDDQDRASRPTGGGQASVAAIDPLDVRHYYRRYVRPDGATLVVSGDTSTLAHPAAQFVAKHLSDWSAEAGDDGGPVSRAVEPGILRRADAARLVFVDRPLSTQSHLTLGRPGPARRTPHGWGVYEVLGFLLGGSPQSRIDAVMREQRGYTYGMHAAFRPRGETGVCSVGGSVRAEVTAEALGTLIGLLSFTGDDLTEDEVRHAADFVAKTAPGRYSTADAIADELIRLSLDGLDADFVTANLATARGVEVSAVAAAWEDVRAGPDWTIVIVGDATAHTEPLRALGLGDLSVVPAVGSGS
ncbi:MAG: pitrilysin family protein [Ornithinimicrobium sp.]